MSFWSGETLCEWVPRFKMIEPFEPARIDCAAYTLAMGSEAYITSDYNPNAFHLHRKRILEEKGGDFDIPAGQFAFLLTEEVVCLPQHVLGFISLKASVKFGGLINVSGFHVDPGFNGHLVYAVYNAGPSSIHLERGMELFLIWFANLDRTDSKFIRRKNVLENTSIGPSLIDKIRGEILTLQSLSERMRQLQTEMFQIKVYGAAAVLFLGLFFAAAKLDLKSLLGIQ